jgi:filamentous hemagglutinin family protein
MKHRGSTSLILRVAWSEATSARIAVTEITRDHGKVSHCTFVAAALSLGAIAACAEPRGGQVTAGAGNISQSGVTTTITQSSPSLSVDWQTFDIAAAETVNFVQPSAAAIAVNRILDPNGTQVLGRLNANGQVYLINPSGILFGRNAQVNVGGLVASTLQGHDIDGESRSFSGNGQASVVNQGTINAATGGYVALLGNNVGNQGVITAHLGSVALGAGSAATLTFSGNSLVRMQVDQSVLNSVADNGGLIRADGGRVLMSAGANDALLASVVNNTGVIEARTVENRDGTIVLLGGMSAGTANVGGTLDASALTGGDGGFIETSAAHVIVAKGARVTTAASMGMAGTWLIDPVDFTIAASGGNMTGADLSANLSGGNVTIQSSGGTVGTAGDVNVSDVVSWSANQLTLSAYNDININAQMNGSDTAALALQYGLGALAAGNLSEVIVHAPVNLPAGPNFSTVLGSDGVIKNFTVITALGAEGSSTASDLQGMSGAVGSNYALGANIDAVTTVGWNANAGFIPVGAFTGSFDGLGHTISGLTINRPGASSVGLFGSTSASAAIGNVGLVGGSVIGAADTGGLVGANGPGNAISNSFNTGTVTGAAGTGGLVGSNTTGAISNSYTTGNVTGAAGTGGLVGSSTSGAISSSYSTGDVNGAAGTGGLVGSNTSGPVTNTYATGDVVSSGAGTGGLIGSSTSGLISNSYSTGSVTSPGAGIGGLIGAGTAGAVTNSYWDTETSGQAASPGGGAGRTSAQMKQQATFQTWDFGSTWRIYETITNPLLLSLMTPLTVTANDLGTTYSAVAHSGGNGVTYSAPLNGIAPAGTLGYGGNSQGKINAGSYAITPSGLVSNQQYLVSFASGTLTIAPAALTLSTSNVSKTYDGGLTALGTATISSGTLFSTDSISGGSFAFTNKNVGSGTKVVATSGVTVNDGNGGGNYIVSYANNTTSTITAASLAVTGVSAVGTRVYDGGTTATLAGTAAVDALGSDVISLGGVGAGVFADRNVGIAKAVTVSGFSLSGTDAGNYLLVQPSGLTANVTAAALTLSTSNVSKTYDAGLSALGTMIITSGSLFSPDSTTGGSFAFTDKNVGTGNKTVATSGVTINDGNSGNNYILTYANNTTSTVTAANLAVTGVSAVGTRVYDGTPAAMLAGTAAVTALGSDVVSLGGVGAGVFADRNVGTAKAITVSGFSLSGADAGNYSLVQPSGLTANVTSAALTVSTSNVSKTYDSGLSALGTATIASGTLFSPDTLTGGSFAFTDKNVGSGNKVVSASGVTVNDGNGGGNYAVTYAGNTTSTITPASLLIMGVSAVGTKAYDGAASAALAGTAWVSTLGADVVAVDGEGTGMFADRNAGIGKSITVTGFTLIGADAANYAIAQPTGLTGDITAANLTLSTINVTKTYDGGLSAVGTAFVTDGTLFDGDLLVGGNFRFTDKNAGVNKIVTADAVTVDDGNSGGNYNVSYANNSSSTILAANLAITGVTAGDKVFDGTTAATLGGRAVVNAIDGDEISVGGTGNGVFDDENIGPDVGVTVSGFTLGGADADNYVVAQPSGVTANIMPKALRQEMAAAVAQLESDALKSQSTAHEEHSMSSIATKQMHECSAVDAPPMDADSLERGDCTVVNIGGASGPRLSIINGGMRLPDVMLKVVNE